MEDNSSNSSSDQNQSDLRENETSQLLDEPQPFDIFSDSENSYSLETSEDEITGNSEEEELEENYYEEEEDGKGEAEEEEEEVYDGEEQEEYQKDENDFKMLDEYEQQHQQQLQLSKYFHHATDQYNLYNQHAHNLKEGDLADADGINLIVDQIFSAHDSDLSYSPANNDHDTSKQLKYEKFSSQNEKLHTKKKQRIDLVDRTRKTKHEGYRKPDGTDDNTAEEEDPEEVDTENDREDEEDGENENEEEDDDDDNYDNYDNVDEDEDEDQAIAREETRKQIHEEIFGTNITEIIKSYKRKARSGETRLSKFEIPPKRRNDMAYANHAYIDRNLDAAKFFLEDILKEAPFAYDCHHLLSLVYEEEKNLQLASKHALSAAYLAKTDYALWRHAAELADSLERYEIVEDCLANDYRVSKEPGILFAQARVLLEKMCSPKKAFRVFYRAFHAYERILDRTAVLDSMIKITRITPVDGSPMLMNEMCQVILEQRETEDSDVIDEQFFALVILKLESLLLMQMFEDSAVLSSRTVNKIEIAGLYAPPLVKVYGTIAKIGLLNTEADTMRTLYYSIRESICDIPNKEVIHLLSNLFFDESDFETALDCYRFVLSPKELEMDPRELFYLAVAHPSSNTLDNLKKAYVLFDDDQMKKTSMEAIRECISSPVNRIHGVPEVGQSMVVTTCHKLGYSESRRIMSSLARNLQAFFDQGRYEEVFEIIAPIVAFTTGQQDIFTGEFFPIHSKYILNLDKFEDKFNQVNLDMLASQIFTVSKEELTTLVDLFCNSAILKKKERQICKYIEKLTRMKQFPKSNCLKLQLICLRIACVAKSPFFMQRVFTEIASSEYGHHVGIYIIMKYLTLEPEFRGLKWGKMKKYILEVNPHAVLVNMNAYIGRSNEEKIKAYKEIFERYPKEASIPFTLGLRHLSSALNWRLWSKDNSGQKGRKQLWEGLINLLKYQHLRIESERADRRLLEAEIDYNTARFFHAIGLNDIAVRRYEKVLSKRECYGDEEFETIRKETAYNLASIYSYSGSDLLAMQVIREHCQF